MGEQNKALLSVPQAAEYLGYSTQRLYQLIAANRVPAVRIGQKRIVIPTAALDKWLEQAALSALDGVRMTGEGVGNGATEDS